MNRRDVTERAESLGYYKLREAKHATLYRQRVTSKIVGVPHTPSDTRSLKNTIAELERGAVTNGRGHLALAGEATGADTVFEAIIAVLKKSRIPMRAKEIADAVCEGLEVSRHGVWHALAVNTKNKCRAGLVRLDRGWYVVDEELAELPATARESAIELIKKRGIRSSYRSHHVRDEAVKFGRSLVEPPDDIIRAESAVVEESSNDATTRLYELVAEDRDENGMVVLRDDSGDLWVARKLSRVVGKI